TLNRRSVINLITQVVARQQIARIKPGNRQLKDDASFHPPDIGADPSGHDQHGQKHDGDADCGRILHTARTHDATRSRKRYQPQATPRIITPETISPTPVAIMEPKTSKYTMRIRIVMPS